MTRRSTARWRRLIHYIWSRRWREPFIEEREAAYHRLLALAREALLGGAEKVT